MESCEAVNALSALAQEARLSIFRLLVEAGPAGLAVGDIGAALDLPGATLSFHLVQLKHADLVTVERRGRQLIHAANFERMNGLLGYLTDNCCGGNGAACKPKSKKAKSKPKAKR